MEHPVFRASELDTILKRWQSGGQGGIDVVSLSWLWTSFGFGIVLLTLDIFSIGLCYYRFWYDFF
jgi:hypothetical protein